MEWSFPDIYHRSEGLNIVELFLPLRTLLYMGMALNIIPIFGGRWLEQHKSPYTTAKQRIGVW
jgi:hypothetical protein